MTTTTTTAPAVPALDMQKLEAFVGASVTDIGTMVNCALIAIGDRLGFFHTLADGAPRTAAQLAAETGTDERYVREWLASVRGAGVLTYKEDRYSLPREHAIALTDETSPACVIGGFQLGLATLQSADRLTTAFRTGEGIGWGEHHAELYPGCERFFAPSYRNFLANEWIPALAGVDAKLRTGGTVADIGCGHGVSTLTMAAAYPQATFVGFDAHGGSVEEAQASATDAGVADRVRFETSDALSYGGTYDLITICDALHDMGDPVGAAAHARAALAPGGTLMVVEPIASDDPGAEPNPVSTAYYAFSTFLCTPSSRSQPVGATLGAQAGEARLAAVLREAGFTSVRRVAETPLNMVLEATG